MKKELTLFVFVPLVFNALLIGFYFSGLESLQHLVSPIISGLSPNSWREFGLLEQLQNVFLLAVVVILSRAAVIHPDTYDRLCFMAGVMIFVFLFLEEIDYGIHFYEYFIGEDSGIQLRNWHNQETDGKQNVKRFKQLMDVLMFVLFIVLPLMKNRISIAFIKNITPPKWFMIGFAISISCSKVAHLLDDQGLGTINNIEGSLSGNISEFRELGSYYFFMLYAVHLLKLDSLFKPRPEH